MNAALAGVAVDDESDIDQCALCYAAAGGHVSCMELARDWGASDFNEALGFAAGAGRLECCLLAVKWGAATFNDALCEAARGGRVGCMAWARSMGATDVDIALSAAAEGGHADCMQVAKVMGATDFDDALCEAAQGGHVDCMVLARRWGARSLDDAMYLATLRGHVPAMKVIRAWDANACPGALCAAAEGGSVAAMEWVALAGKPAATEYPSAMFAAISHFRPACVRWLMARGWAVSLEKIGGHIKAWCWRTYEQIRHRQHDVPKTVLELARRLTASEIRQLVLTLQGYENRKTPRADLDAFSPKFVPLIPVMVQWLTIMSAWCVHKMIVNAYIALLPLDLPLYVVHWILEWVEPHGLAAAKRVRLLQNIRASANRIKGAPLDE